MEHTFWIWYPGDFELYHAMKQNFSRVERGFGWPAFWKSEGFRNRVAFRRTYELEQETSFTVFSNAIGHVLVTRENGEKKYPFGKKITVAQVIDPLGIDENVVGKTVTFTGGAEAGTDAVSVTAVELTIE